METEIPRNGGYMVAAYLIVIVVILGYSVSLWRRSRRITRR